MRARAAGARWPVAALLALALAGGARVASAATAHVTYLAGSSVYLDAGRLEGLAEGDTLDLYRGGTLVARLRVTVVSSHRASCDTLLTRGEVAIGDLARFTPHPAVPPEATGGAAGATPGVVDSAGRARARSEGSARWRGRVGVRWLAVVPPGGGGLRQPGLDLRFDGWDGGDRRVDAAIDVRARASTQLLPDGTRDTEALSRVYRASLSFHDQSGRNRLTLGRQSSPALAAISLFDGGLFEYGGGRASVGLFSGTQPEPVRLQVSGAVVEHGAFVQLRQRKLAATRWSLALGAVTSTENGSPNRDFGFLQGFLHTPRISGSLTQEVDLNRGWKRDLGEPLLSPTSTFLTVRAELARWSTVHAGYDDRRSVRLYRDRTTPESEFDDRHRQGAWLGMTLEPVHGVRTMLEGRHDGGGGDPADTWTVSAEAWRLLPAQGSLHARYSQFRSTPSRSDLLSLGLGLEPLAGTHLEISGGVRSTRDRLLDLLQRTSWIGADLDLSLARRWYLNGGLDSERGDGGQWLTYSAGVSWRF